MSTGWEIFSDEVVGNLSVTYPAKGYQLIGLKNASLVDSVCESRYMIPASNKELIAKLKSPTEQRVKIIYSHAMLKDGGTRKHCMVENVIFLDEQN
ncbi:MAG: hypothetical protein HKN88_04665 [Gammaproteobacteria bacterium]|nr:hypothetical protein [Gammaproteobacteria bacterium]NNC97345.1 hypothetical protein [Gammaproteobacteria bacterium]NNM13136.1 hypothetical protein [Gammaproteobacteria bacterium]